MASHEDGTDAVAADEIQMYDGDSDASSGINIEVEQRAGFRSRYSANYMLQGLSSSKEDPAVYKKRQEKAIARQMEIEHLCTFAYFRYAINQAWSSRRRTSGWADVERKFAPPDYTRLWEDYNANFDAEKANNSPITPASHASRASSVSKSSGGLPSSRGKGLAVEMDGDHSAPRNGFDVFFEDWLGDTKRGHWPLHKDSKHTLDDAGVLIVTHAFTKFVAKWKGFWWGILAAVIEGTAIAMLPQIMGLMVEQVSSGVSCAGHESEEVCLEEEKFCSWILDGDTGDYECSPQKAIIYLAIWCGVYWACYQVTIWAEWISDWWSRLSNIRRDFRPIILGRMLKFRPLPNPGEAAFLLHEGVHDVVENCWWAIFAATKEGVGFGVALAIIVLNIHECVLDLVLMLAIPMFIMALFALFFYLARRRNAHDMARRRFHWYSTFYGYVYSLTTLLQPVDANQYDIDEECSTLYRLTSIMWYRNWGLKYWKLSSVGVVENFCSSIAMLMIFFAGVSAFNGNLETGNFVAIAGSCWSLVTQSAALMQLLTRKSSGYESILRIAKVLNNSELKACYNKKGNIHGVGASIVSG